MSLLFYPDTRCTWCLRCDQGLIRPVFYLPIIRCEQFQTIFHCDTKSFALGTFASPNTKDSAFALPNARNTNMLVSFALGGANFLRWPCTFHFLCVDFIRVG